jgi:hypothetical protein
MLILGRWQKLTIPFEENIKSENRKIEWLLDTPAFQVKKSMNKEERIEYEKKKNARWNTYNLIPSEEEGYEKYEEAEYQYKMLCFQAADGNLIEYSRLFNECSLVEVYEIIMLKRAYNW